MIKHGSSIFLSQEITRSGCNKTCVVLYDDEFNDEFLDAAANTAKFLDLPLIPSSGLSRGGDFTHALRLIPYEIDRLSTFALAIEPINDTHDEGRKRGRRQRRTAKVKKQSPFYVDLCPPINTRAGRRAAGLSGTSDLLIKAVTPRKALNSGKGDRDGAIIYDLTAGFGQDALLLAINGASHVHMVERHPIVAALLQDAMRRLELISSSTSSVSSDLGEEKENDRRELNVTAKCESFEFNKSNRRQQAIILLRKLSLTIGDGKEIIQKQHHKCCDVIYLDPMFPPRQKQAAVKKGMQILHGLLETQSKKSVPDNNLPSFQEEKETEEHGLLSSALDAAKLRVVVKRPIKAPPLEESIAKPSYAINGSVNRWDVYVSS